LRIKNVQQLTGIRSRSGIYQRLNPNSPYHDPTFPRPFRIGIRAIGWSSAEVNEWIAKCATTLK
jgi:prophage regulatory protein